MGRTLGWSLTAHIEDQYLEWLDARNCNRGWDTGPREEQLYSYDR